MLDFNHRPKFHEQVGALIGQLTMHQDGIDACLIKGVADIRGVRNRRAEHDGLAILRFGFPVLDH